MNHSLSNLVREEAAKRDRNWDPKARWQVIQETIAWADSQATVRRNTKQACLANQQRILAEWTEYKARMTLASE